MTDSLHDTLTAEHHAREQLEHDTRDISEKLEQIKWWYPQLSDIMLTISSQALDLTGIRGTTQRIPGGDALTMLGPWSAGYDEPDDLPHPAQVIREWADRWRDATRTPHDPTTKWAGHLAVLQANAGWFIRQDQSGAFRDDIRALWGRLRALTGNQERETRQHRGPEELQSEAKNIPDDKHLTLRQADQCAPGIENRVKRDRNAERDRAKKAKRPPEYKCDPEGSLYSVADLRRHYGFPAVEIPAEIM